MDAKIPKQVSSDPNRYHYINENYVYRPDFYRDPDYNIPDECDLSNKPHNRDKW